MNKQIRTAMRSRRKGLASADRNAFAVAAAQAVIDIVPERSLVASYRDFDGELPTYPLHQCLEQKSCTICVPVINKQSMIFRRLDPENCEPNQFGIDEPVQGEPVEPSAFWAVFVPLTAFSESGYRLGMGAGYYDRCFAFRRERLQSPRLIGLAYDFQKSSDIEVFDHDVPLDAVATPTGLRWFTSLR